MITLDYINVEAARVMSSLSLKTIAAIYDFPVVLLHNTAESRENTDKTPETPCSNAT